MMVELPLWSETELTAVGAPGTFATGVAEFDTADEFPMLLVAVTVKM